MNPELQAELDAVHARHAARAEAEKQAELNATHVSGEPVSRAEVAAIRRDLNAVMTVMQSHFGRELVIAQASN